MDNYFFSDEMLSDSFGTYNAAAMRIKITKTADSKPINHQKFSLLSNFDCTTLFHEYIHHLQNTSTITGIQHLDLLVSMWQNTRNYIDKENDIGSYERSKSAFIKSFEYNDNNKSILNRKKEFFIHLFNDLSATFGFFLNSAPPPENILQPASITCMQGENKIIVKFGIYEFQEGCAHLMEKVLCEKTQLEADKYNADLIPYKIIFYIRDHLFSKCTNENLIAIMLAAMQHAAPHKLFIFLLTLGPDDIDKIRNIAREMVNSRLSDNKKRMLVLRKKGFNQREIAEIISSLTGKKLSHQAVSKAILSVREEFLLYDIRD